MLNKLKSKQLNTKEAGRLYDGGGLIFYTRTGAQGAVKQSWVFRFSLNGKRVDMGLGPFPAISMREAREMREKYEAAVREGRDPRKLRQDEIAAVRAADEAASDVPTLEDMVRSSFGAIKNGLKGGGKNGRWLSPMEKHVFPSIGSILITELTQKDIRDCLAPIWQEKYPTCDKILGRLNQAIAYADDCDLEVDVRAVQKARRLLGDPGHEVENASSLPFKLAPGFYAQLPLKGSGAVLRALMLTGVRSAEIRLSLIERIDWEAAILTSDKDIVKSTVKRAKENRIALSTVALALFRGEVGERTEGHVFLGPRGKPIWDATPSKYMRESAWLKERDVVATPHGMRATIKDFLLTCHQEIPPHIIELVLSHAIDNKVGAAYTRTDLIDHQRAALERWGRYLVGDRTPIVDQFSPKGVVAGGVPASE
jgi:integrase